MDTRPLFADYDLPLIGTGRNRAVYALPGGRYVLKVPLNDDGSKDNYYEACQYRRFREHGDEIPKARCRLVPGTNLLVMEKICPVRYSPRLPSWVDSVDCAQVGHNRAGHLVAYDFGRC